MFGGGGMNSRKMEQMMKQMGIDMEELDAEEVVIRTGDEELVFASPQVTKMDAQGQETYQIVGSPDTRDASDDEAAAGTDAADDAGSAIPDDDVELVAQRAGVPPSDAREALEANDGDLAAAISDLE
jgi:nascent polypeptide-associated complex subunit alpha